VAGGAGGWRRGSLGGGGARALGHCRPRHSQRRRRPRQVRARRSSALVTCVLGAVHPQEPWHCFGAGMRLLRVKFRWNAAPVPGHTSSSCCYLCIGHFTVALHCCRSARTQEQQALDDYDVEYDRGRVKRVRGRRRSSDRGGDGERDSNRFQQAWTERSRGAHYGSSSGGGSRGTLCFQSVSPCRPVAWQRDSLMGLVRTETRMSTTDAWWFELVHTPYSWVQSPLAGSAS
jgi:hypothetical protein